MEASEPLKNSRHEAFAQDLATPKDDGGYLSQGQAYSAAGYSLTGDAASKSASSPPRKMTQTPL